ncbi:ATP-binding protein [Anaeromyxobacter sp. Fw109-5]|uniref:ATP-binding protein n=1 Tax=Anaeromyxobacter sp. (strain Fw109-5) TaxID=404589 RepID=UPI0000ED6CDF|nr:DUF499 domain-containing protein [Anaeromyxobacter sp. Fw109-5]ABS28163.1 ATPase (AAA+ superfamily)-like protein [Anaeromyxobacter sp. Fw109-5]
MALKPWYKIVTPREDLREGKPLDASEFAVHLDHVRDGRAPAVYQDPAQFFARTFLTKNLRELTAQVVRRLSGVKVETSAIFNLSTQFGGGKTHSLTLLYHLAQNGDAAKSWKGVSGILDNAGLTTVPRAATAIFVGTEFDSITGRGGTGGTPVRKTPWGEIAFQLGGAEGFKLVEEHEKALTAPGGDVIERILPSGKPALILFDEVMNYVSRSRKSGLAGQLYTFLHNLSEVARGRDNIVLAVSIPASELEMTAEDQSDFERFKKLLDRVGKAVIMSAEAETSEIIRRRLFEWSGLPKDAIATVDEYEQWLLANKQQIPSWFPVENAREALKASYPFHPSLLSVFERKWQGLPRFQQTRGVLRLLALWVSKAYSEGYKGAHKDPLVSLGTAPLEDPLFRAAVFEQLGEARLEPAVTTDIAGTDHAHALRLDAEATAEIKKARLHRKVATTILFESNGGQQRGDATLPEVRLAVAEPGLDIGNVEQCLEALTDACYFLAAEKNRYRFSFQPNLNKLLADRRASVTGAAIDEVVRKEIQKVFAAGSGIERLFFPKKSGEVPDRPVLTMLVLAPDNPAGDAATKTLMTSITTESGSSSRTFKSALIWVAPEDSAPLMEEARKLLAWRDIEADAEELKLDEAKQRQLAENAKRAERDLRESVWRAYKNVFLLAEDNSLRKIDLGLVHSSAANSLVELILSRLKQEDIVVEGVSPNFLTRYWPPALPEWSTKSVRDAFYASPKFPRLLRADAVKDTISKGLDAGIVAYVGKKAGGYDPFVYKRSLAAADVEIAEDVFLIAKERAEEYVARKPPPQPPIPGGGGGGGGAQPGAGGGVPGGGPGPGGGGSAPGTGGSGGGGPAPTPPIAGFQWTGDVSPQKWMNFYTKVLSRFATGGGLKLTVAVDVAPPGGTTSAKIEETKVALRELGLSEDITTKSA